MIRMV